MYESCDHRSTEPRYRAARVSKRVRTGSSASILTRLQNRARKQAGHDRIKCAVKTLTSRDFKRAPTDDILVHMYQNNEPHATVERVQTGVRIEKRILKVMKALAEYHDLTLGDLIEGIVLHAFEGKSPFGPESLKLIAELKKLYHLDLDSSASHKLIERKPARKKRS